VLAVSIDDVDAAARVLAGEVVRTPTAESRTLGALTGADVWVKFEQLQFTASFKERGARNRLEHLDDDERRRGVIAVSAGNHAQGVAHHAARLGIPATIVMPAVTPSTKVARTRVLGAEVVLTGESFEDASTHAAHIAAERGLVPVHPFDDPLVVAGQGTVGLELIEDVEDLEVVVVPIGGGGLISGVATAFKARAPHVEVVGVQVAGYDWAARRRGGPVTAAAGPTVAEGIAVKHAGTITAPIVDALVDDVVVVSEDAVEQAITMYLEIEKVVAEGAGAAGLAALVEHPDRFAGRRCGLVLCGGNIDLRLLATIAMRGLALSGRLTRFVVPVDDRPGALARVVGAIAAAGGNVVDLQHARHRPDLPSRRAELAVVVETGDPDDLAAVLRSVTSAGFDVDVDWVRASPDRRRPTA
jgi:threonine dehydratase